MVLTRFKDGRDQKLGVKWLNLLFEHDIHVPHDMRPCSECASSQADLDLRFWQRLCGVSFLGFFRAISLMAQQAHNVETTSIQR